MKIIGLDLAGKDKNPTGFCLLTETGSKTKVLYKDEEILKEIDFIKPDLICIDAPFGFPKSGYWRNGDKALLQQGFKPLSPIFPGMKFLVNRAIKIVSILKNKKYKVIEVFPRATEKILGLKQAENTNEHEYDALLCALTGKYYLEGNYKVLGKEFKIIVPKE